TRSKRDCSSDVCSSDLVILWLGTVVLSRRFAPCAGGPPALRGATYKRSVAGVSLVSSADGGDSLVGYRCSFKTLRALCGRAAREIGRASCREGGRRAEV